MRLNRLRLTSTPLASVEVAAVRCLVGDGSSGVDFSVEVEGDAYVARLPIRDVKALVRRDVRDFACTLPLTRRGQSTPFTLPLTFGYRREPDAVARVRASRESLTVAEESLVEEEEEPTVIVRARRAFLQDEAPAPRGRRRRDAQSHGERRARVGGSAEPGARRAAAPARSPSRRPLT